MKIRLSIWPIVFVSYCKTVVLSMPECGKSLPGAGWSFSWCNSFQPWDVFDRSEVTALLIVASMD